MTTPAKFAADHTYTDQELLDLWRQCYATVSVMGQTYVMGDREWTAADNAEIIRNIQFLESRINAASGANPSQILARFPGR